MAKALRLHTLPDDADVTVEVGEEFEIFDENDSTYFVMVAGYPMSFTKEPDMFGLSYKDWFEVVE